MEAMDSHLREVARWREMPLLDSRETHFSFLEDLINPHIEFIRQGILNQNTEDTPRKLEILKMFIEEAHERQESRRVSYRWWVNFNYRLSILISAEKNERGPGFHLESDWISNSGLEKHYLDRDTYFLHFRPSGLSCFPEVALCPIKNGNLGYFTFNRIATTRVYPLGLVNKDIPVNGRSMNPQRFFEHDETHFTSSDIALKKWRGKNILEKRVIPFHRAFLQKMDTLSVSERKDAEWMYFTLFHEISYMFWRNEEHISTKKGLIKAKLRGVKTEDIHNFMDIVYEVERDLGW